MKNAATPEPFESVRLEFIEQALDDMRRSELRPLGDYLARFPGCQEAVASEYQRLVTQAERSASEATGSCFFRRLQREQVLPGPSVGAGRVVGDYRLLALLGRGGMGQVWEAEQISLGGRRVAVKFVRPDRVTPRQLEFFQREARAGGRLHHPGIVEVHAYGECDGLAWISMEVVDGAWTLRDSIDEVARSGEAPPDYDRAVARLVAEIADAMQAAHQAGVIHRDLKPQNVLITPDERPKVTDFGLARISDEAALSQTGDFAGTYLYMSPEQIGAKRVRIDHRTDVFSLGVILYEMLALRRPFQGDTSHQIAEQILVSDPPDPRSFRSRIASELVAIIGKALEKDRARRYVSMADFADDLRRWLAHRPILARPTPPWRRLAKWALRHPAKSGVSAVVMVAVTVIVVLFTTVLRKVDEFERLAAVQELQDLEAAADRLWPPWPERIGSYESWILQAETLLEGLPQFRAMREEYGRGLSAGGVDVGLERDPRLEGVLSKPTAQVASRTAEVALPAIESAGSSPRPPEKQSIGRWWITQLDKLIEGLEALRDPKTGLLGPEAISEEHGWSVPKRLAMARRLLDLVPRWDAELPAIREFYGLPDLSPAPGLIPIGQDPDSGLFEFWHVASGREPKRGIDGRLVVQADMGIVLVLVPSGSFLIGAQKDDPSKENYDAMVQGDELPVEEVGLSGFYVGKFEATRAQWIALNGEDSYVSNSGVPLEPVGEVSWTACVELLTRHGLQLPTEEQWEYACRAETQTCYWSGDSTEDLDRVGWYENNSDAALHEIAKKLASPWGLHDVHGNASELCQDENPRHKPKQQTKSDDPAKVSRVIRGGSFEHSAEWCRSACRVWGRLVTRDRSLGFRVALPAVRERGD